MENCKTLVTGALGFIGSHYCSEPTWWMDNRSTNKVNSVPGKETAVFIPEVDKVVHLAASASISPVFSCEMMDNNVGFTYKLIDFYKDKRIQYASSAAVHAPNNQYAQSKVYCEWLAQRYNATGYRFYNVYGKNDNGVVGKILQALRNDTFIDIFGGNQVRDFISVDDVVRIMNEPTTEKIVEVGTGIGTTINELIEVTEMVAGKKLKTIYRPLNEHEQFQSICREPVSNYIRLEDGIKTLWNTL